MLLRTANVLTPDGGDEVAAIRHVLADASLDGPVNAVAPQAVTNRDFTSALGRVLGRPTPWFAPAPVLGVIAGRERAREALLSSAKVVPARLQVAGFRFGDPDLGAGPPADPRVVGSAPGRSRRLTVR